MMPKKDLISHERLLSVLSYSVDDGLFRWRQKLSRASIVGGVAGCANSYGHIRIVVDGRFYMAHRLAWFYVYGVWPLVILDHINRLRSDNRISNLREANYKQNQWNINMRPSNRSGFTGVYWESSKNLWRAACMTNGVKRYLGYFRSAEEASKRYLEHVKDVRGEGWVGVVSL
jgi:HNH endonuclease